MRNVNGVPRSCQCGCGKVTEKLYLCRGGSLNIDHAEYTGCKRMIDRGGCSPSWSCHYCVVINRDRYNRG